MQDPVSWAGCSVIRPGLPLAIAIPAGVIMAILLLAGTFRIPEGPVDYSAFFPHGLLNATLFGHHPVFLPAGFAGNREVLERYETAESTRRGNVRRDFLFSVSWVRSFPTPILQVAGSRKPGKAAHLLLFYGFTLLILVTLYAIWATLTRRYPLPLKDPFKVLGNVASLMIYTGLGDHDLAKAAKQEGLW